MAEISLEQMLQAGVHFGHQTKYWNPKMDQHIFGVRNKIHIINLEHTVEMIKPAMKFIESVAAKNNKILFVGTKRTATDIVKNEAIRCSMPYVNERWLGGMLTNYKTIRSSITRLENLLRQKEDGTFAKLTKKEGLKIQRDIDRLEKSIGGVTEMGGLPDALFIIDVKRESIAVSEASKMGIPIVGIVDSNSNPEGIDYVIPGNDDSIRSIALFTEAVADACMKGSKAATGLKQDEPQSGPAIVRKVDNNDIKEENLKDNANDASNTKNEKDVVQDTSIKEVAPASSEPSEPVVEEKLEQPSEATEDKSKDEV
jgi:small subunit ribosomal protein S2